jgi:hypothetical protein
VVRPVRTAHEPDGLRLAIDPATCALTDLVDELRFAAFWCVEAEGRPPAGPEAGPRVAQVRAVLEAAAGHLAQQAERLEGERRPAGPATEVDHAAVVQAAHQAAGAHVDGARADARRLHADARGAVHDVLAALDELQQAEHALVGALRRLAP